MKNIIIDCDPGIDDALALIYAIKSQYLNLKAITIVSGNVPSEQGLKNAYKVLDLLGSSQVKVYKGENSPLVRELITAEDTHGDDGLGETDYSYIDREEELQHGVDTILLNASKDNHLIALGPLTNIASAIKKDSERFNEYSSVTVMGGNYKVQGNCTKYSEYNFWVDPHAADYVFTNTQQVINLVPLDVTREILLTPEHRTFIKNLKSNISKFVYDITQYYVNFHKEWEGIDGCVINDPLAVACVETNSLLEGFEACVKIQVDGEHLGRTTLDSTSKKNNAKVFTKVKADTFFKQFFTTIFN